MAAEIAEQPQGIARTLEALLPMRAELARATADRREVLFVARGSSDNATVYARYLLEVHARRRAGFIAPSVATHYGTDLDLSDTVVVAVSQSGETDEIVEAERWASRCGARTIAVTNHGESSLADVADIVMVTRAGTERAVPATKSHTAQLSAMAVLATALAPDPTFLDAELDRVPGEVDRLLTERAGVDEAVARLALPGEEIVTGRGLVFGTAREIALKIEETCLRPVRGLSYADLRHGPIAVVDPDLDAVLVAPVDGPVADGMRELATDLRNRGVRATIGIGGNEAFAAACDVAVPGPRLTEAAAPLALVVPGQLIVESLCRELGLDPDAPRGLKKVTSGDV